MPQQLHATTVATADGDFTIITDETAVRAAGWTDCATLLERLQAHADVVVSSWTQSSLRPPRRQQADSSQAWSGVMAATNLGTAGGAISAPVTKAGESTSILDRAAAAVLAYYDGDPGSLTTIPVRQRAGDFHRRVHAALHATRYGEQLSYTELATRAGNPRAVRAAATACANNLIALFVPCHRALRCDGSLGGFRYGLDLKRSLLRREQKGL